MRLVRGLPWDGAAQPWRATYHLLRRFGVRTQSTLIAFKGNREQGRSAGDTDRASIYALVGKTL